jgi:hypothetical protein
MTFQLLDEGERKIQLSERYKSVSLVLGNTGAGRSTFVQWIAGDIDKLIAKEEYESKGEYLIECGNRIGNSTLQSMTIFPEFVVHPVTNTAFYDCPGFSDTRNTSKEISAAYFIKKVTDYVEHVKLIFIVNHSSVSKAVDRQDFLKLLRHATDFIKDVDKYQRSIAIVVTKVDNMLIKIGRSYQLVPDETVIGAIGYFLEGVKQLLRERQKCISGEEKKFCTQALKFLNVLLSKNGEHYSRIGIFRRPYEPGPLSNISLLQEGKKRIEKNIERKPRVHCDQ